MNSMISKTDDELVGLYSEGNGEAFDVLLSRYKDKLYAYISFIVRIKDIADDIFQDTFVKAIQTIQRGGYTSAGKFGAWLTRIAHNLIMDYFRKDNVTAPICDDENGTDLLNNPDLCEPNVEDRMVNRQILSDVRHLVSMLPDNQREVVFMRYYQDLSFKEISDITGVSINTALGRMRYALINIRKMAADNDINLNLI